MTIRWPLGVELALEVASLEDVARRIEELLEIKPPEGMIDKLKMLPKLAEMGSFFPKTDGITGTLSEANGQPISFSLGLSTGDAGVYRAELTNSNGTYIGGWIVLPSGEQRGAVSFQGGVGDAYLPKGGIVPVIKLKIASPTVVLQNNISLTASKLGG